MKRPMSIHQLITMRKASALRNQATMDARCADAPIQPLAALRADGRPFMPYDLYAPGGRCNSCDGGDPDGCPWHGIKARREGRNEK